MELIVQWRAPHSICALWQRVGRAARDSQRTAKAIVLVEPKHFDATRAGRLERAAERAAKQAKTGAVKEGPTIECPAAPSHSGVSKAPRKHTSAYKESSTASKKRKDVEVEPVLDDFINACTQGLHCFRQPATIYFENQKTRS